MAVEQELLDPFPPVETVSVIISAYNGEKYIGEAIESARTQTASPHEIIVVDDGSSDRSVDIARSYDDVVLVQQANAGRCAARNTGLAKATGDAIIFLDQDDRLLPENIETGMVMLNNFREAAFSAGFSVLIDEHGHRGVRPKVLGTPPPCTYVRLLEGHVFVPPSCVMFRRVPVETVGGWDNKFLIAAEDDDIFLRVAGRYPVVAHEKVIVEYRRHSENGSGSAYNLVRASLQLYHKHRLLIQHDPALLAALDAGLRHKLKLFGDKMVDEGARKLRRGQIGDALKVLAFAAQRHPSGFISYAASRTRRLFARK
jgi:glycosyltransferase involved in cell wall biosynthesis